MKSSEFITQIVESEMSAQTLTTSLNKPDSKIYEYGEVDTKRIIQFNKENPPNLDYLYQQFVQRMLSSDNKIDPYEWIDKVNDHYGLNYTWKDYQKRGHNDYTNNWQKIINKYILKK